jgi:ABC-2 type transport system ATP-binding protein
MYELNRRREAYVRPHAEGTGPRLPPRPACGHAVGRLEAAPGARGLPHCTSRKLLLLDEPTAGVDPKARREFWDEIHRLAAGGLTVLVSTHYMDEAERCHRISYIAYGRMLATGTVDEVVRDAGLVTYVVRGADLNGIARELEGAPGVDQVAPFGTTLHVVGSDAALLAATMKPIVGRDGVTVELGETSLEDVFIQFMGASRDNMQ